VCNLVFVYGLKVTFEFAILVRIDGLIDKYFTILKLNPICNVFISLSTWATFYFIKFIYNEKFSSKNFEVSYYSMIGILFVYVVG